MCVYLILQSALGRRVIEQGMFVKHFKVEVYQMELLLCENSKLETLVPRKFSRADAIGTFDSSSLAYAAPPICGNRRLDHALDHSITIIFLPKYYFVGLKVWAVN